MTTSQDQMARKAAQLLRDRLARDIPDAILQARGSQVGDPGPLPSVEQVRRHVDAMNMALEGFEGWHQGRRERLEEVEQFLAAMEHFINPVEIRVAGRAARGELDPGDRVTIRAWTGGPLDELAQAMDTAGLGVPEAGSRKVNRSMATGVPRLGTLTYAGDTVELMVSLCPTREVALLDRNLVTGKPIALATPDEIRAILDRYDTGNSQSS